MEISLASYTELKAPVRTVEEVDLLLRDLRPWLFRLALAITTRPDSAEDAAQEALIRAAKSRHKLTSVQEPRAWLRTVVVRCALTSISKITPERLIDQEIHRDPTETLAVRQILDRMDPTDRVVLALSHFEELSYAEIADTLGIPVGTVGSRLHSARESFKREWTR
ncbi:MAG: RNA polymerase sigma factor [Fimbriimonas sp.]|nr:RNA polymerase sigma factor [Fimbriimonas sp.]